ncbi:MAG: hypothetical protein Fur0018_05400 [Anaerolineales bacterium]
MNAALPDTSASQGLPRKANWRSIAQLGVSLLALTFLWGQAIGTLTLAFVPALSTVVRSSSRSTLLAIAFASFVLGLLVLLSAVYAFRDLSGRDGALPWHPFLARVQQRAIWLAPLVFAAAFGLGWWARENPQGKFLAFPWLHFLAAAMPVWWWVSISARQTAVHQSPQRRWGLVTAGLSFGPIISILAEVLLLMAGLVMLMAVVAQNEQAAATLESLGRRFAFAAGDAHTAQRMVQGLLQTYPWLGLAGLAFISIFVPLIEELGKSLGVWALIGQELTYPEGFLAGAISGGMFALFEGLYNAGATRSQWGSVMLGRVGTSLMHVTASGLMGAALADAWRNRRYVRLGATYLLAVGLHGTWNAAVIGLTVGAQLWHSPWLTAASSAAIGAVLAFCLGVLLRTRGTPTAPVVELAVAFPETENLTHEE